MPHSPYRYSALLCIAALLLPTAAFADCGNDSWWSDACRRANEIWAEGGDDLYVPLHTYHLRSAYSAEAIARFNETPLGLGYGRSRIKDNQWEGLYGFVFLDSNNKPEPIVGYGHQWLWGSPQGLRAGLGYTLLVTARNDILSYAPIPGILPMGSVYWGKLSVSATFLPGTSGNGNIFFFWSTLSF
jgi:palmitoyl transferase